jgi:hypothetical protein
MPRLLLALALLLLAPSVQASDVFFVHSTWANWRGSLMHFGFYDHSIYNCQPAKYAYGFYFSNEPLIPLHCNVTYLGGCVDGENIKVYSNPVDYPTADDCNVHIIWTGRIIEKEPKRLCTKWTATMRSGQVITGADTFWFIGAEPPGTGPWVWQTRPKRDGCGVRGHIWHGPLSLPDPTIPRPPIQPPPRPSPSPYVK